MADAFFQMVSSLPITPQHQAWPMLPGGDEEDDDATQSRCFLNLAEKKLYKIKNVFQPFLDACRLRSLLHPVLAEELYCQSCFVVRRRHQICCGGSIYGTAPSKLAFCIDVNDTWEDLGGGEDYSDIISYNSQLYALTDSGSVEVWDFRSNPPKKIMNLRPSGRSTVHVDMENFPRDKFSNQFYLVESSGDLLFVNRVFGNFVNSEGVATDEAGLLHTEDTHPLVCPYRTKQFFVYKLDSIRNTWEKVESLPDRAVFLGGNHSLSLSTSDLHEGCESNTIYFTDDNWDQMNEDYLYGGHDLGQFNLASGNLQTGVQCCCLWSERMDPPPFWIIP
ncbi:hypothetical protein FH972_001655 [Carpinus fangiana]|uniref:KIB1-4 beta-propeller domain-containing protein n=1 Tax=Carpinus fangiana TaxID=176857 RepID=A0A5N6QE80_9ROSI|nr:hypothetical protein FH972_001655 [Carpinus fangiana]